MKPIGLAALVAALASNAYAEDTTLEFWTWYPAKPVLNRVISEFESANPGIKVNLNLYDSGAYQDRMPLGLASEDPMDIVAVQTSTMVNQVKDSLIALDAPLADGTALLLDATLNADALTQARSLADDGALYIAPMGTLGSVVAYYNMDLMEELALEIPKTRADLAALVETVNAKRPDLLPVSFTGANWFLDEIGDTISEQVEPGFFNSVRYDAGGSWDSDTYRQSFETLVGLYRDGIFSRDTLDLDYGRASEIFLQGQSVMYLQGSWEDGLLSAPFREANQIPLNNISGSPLPVLVDGGQPAIRSFIEVGLAIPAHSENQSEAAKFIEFMVAGDGVDAWSDSLFVVPTKAGYEIPEEFFSTEASREGYLSIAALLSNPSSDRNNVSDFSAAKGDAIIAAILNGTSTEESVTYLQSEWESGRYSNAQ